MQVDGSTPRRRLAQQQYKAVADIQNEKRERLEFLPALSILHKE